MQYQNDYDQIAHLYDRYVQVDIDLDFFRECVSRCSGPVLELMAGTGRVSKAISDHGPRLTCIDISRKMLRELNTRFSGAPKRPDVVCADIRSLPLDSRYELVIIPFNSFLELATFEDQQRAMNEISRVLTMNGEFVCTLHNPDVRARSLDGEERLLGRFPLAGDQQLELWVKGTLDQQTGLANSQQTYIIYDKSGRLASEHLQEVRFALIPEERLRDLCDSSGFEVLQLVGNYDGSPYDRETSPFLIFTMRKNAVV